MPTPEIHLSQYYKNRKFLNSLMQQENTHYDWVVTIAFYSALHLIDKCIVSEILSVELKDHKNRNNLVNSLEKLKPIRREYLSLQWDSHQSRYLCVDFNKKNAELSIKKLEKIENHLIK